MDHSEFRPVVISDRDGNFTDALAARKIEFHILPLRSGRSPWSKLAQRRHSRALIELAQRSKIALVHCSYLWMSRSMKAIAQGAGIPSILHIRKPLTPRQIKKNRCDTADRLITISQRSKTNLLDAGIAKEKIEVISDGIPLDIYHPLPPAAPSAEFMIGIAGRISPKKFQMEFLQAAAILSPQLPLRILFAGQAKNPKYKDDLIQFAMKHNLADRITFLDYVEQMPEFLNTLDVLVSLSGRSIMYEAMACGTAVLSAGFTPTSFAMHVRNDETGVCLDSRDPAAIAKALKTLWDNPERRTTLARNGLREAQSHLGSDTMARKTIDLYRSLLP